MYVYIDESGNTGERLFDEQQPIFYSLATISPVDCDRLAVKHLSDIQGKLSVDELHANELGLSKINLIAHDIFKVIKKFRLRFLFTEIEKPYVALARLFDCLFDPHENAAVPWHIYNHQLMRMLTLVKFGQITPFDQLETFWNGCMLERNQERARDCFIETCNCIAENIQHLSDERSREVIGESLSWAVRFPDNIIYSADSTRLRRMNAANFVAITTLFPNISQLAKKKNKHVVSIIHDEQSQFGGVFQYYHGIMINAQPYHPPSFFGGAGLDFTRIRNSQFSMSSSANSQALQLTDVMLFLFKKHAEGVQFRGDILRLFKFATKKTTIAPFSSQAALDSLEEGIANLYSLPMTREMVEGGQELSRLIEERRLAEMRRIEEAATQPDQ